MGLAEPWPLSESCSRQGKLRGPDSGRSSPAVCPQSQTWQEPGSRGRCCLPTREGQGLSADQTGLYPGGWEGQEGWGASQP